jgi:hypothetical protein
METDPTLEFEFFLAQKLGRTVAELRQMDNGEFAAWQVYYARKAQREELAMARVR